MAGKRAVFQPLAVAVHLGNPAVSILLKPVAFRPRLTAGLAFQYEIKFCEYLFYRILKKCQPKVGSREAVRLLTGFFADNSEAFSGGA